jgi:hypothetical protein
MVRAEWVNLGALLLALGGAEALFAKLVTRRDRSAAQYPQGYFQPDDDLAGAPAKASSARVRKWHDSTLVYDVVYTFGANGLRRAPCAVIPPADAVQSQHRDIAPMPRADVVRVAFGLLVVTRE